jgi:hypothetical protein
MKQNQSFFKETGTKRGVPAFLRCLTTRQQGLFNPEGEPVILRHYTQLPIALKILDTGAIRLAPTSDFSDPKDKAWSARYQRERGLPALYAACFTWETELIHHWNAYAGGPYGCCLAFAGPPLIAAARAAGVRCAPVAYVKNIDRDAVARAVPPADWPFTKAWTYRCEYEYRFVSETLTDLPAVLPYLRRVTLTSRMSGDLFDFYNADFERRFPVPIVHSTLEKSDDDEA